jgi:ABC-type sugar transport system permease subunit
MNKQLFEKESVLAIVLLLPAMIVIFGVLIFPLVTSLGLSFTDLKLTEPDSGSFIGFKNFITALKAPLFWAAIGRTTIFGVSTVLTEIILGVLIALLLNQQFKGKKIFRGLVMLPWALPYVVNGIMWKWMFDANYGAVNAFLTQTGIMESYRIWLGEPLSAIAIVIFANIWKETPVAVILIIAALQSIPKELYEAASIDGANGITKFKRITFPMLKPIITSLVVIKTIWALKEFDLVYIITKGGPANSTNLFSYYIYQHTFRFLDFGYGSALAYLLTILTIILAFFYMKSLKGGLDVEN